MPHTPRPPFRIAFTADFYDESGAPKFTDLGLDNVLLAPHSIAWTNELFRDIGRAACQSMLDLSLGRRPQGVLNSQLFQRASFRDKWRRTVGGTVD